MTVTDLVAGRPTVRPTVDADIPDEIARDTEVATAVADHAAGTDPHADRAYTDSQVTAERGRAESVEGGIDSRVGALEAVDPLTETEADGIYRRQDDPLVDGDIPATIARDSEVATHGADTTNVHGISDTSALVVTTDPRLTDARSPSAHATSHQDGGSDELALDGSQITTGTVADARVASTIARDSEVATAVSDHAAASDPHGDRAYAAGLFATNDALLYKGALDCSANPNYPAADAGHAYKVSVAGKLGGASGVNVEVGDLAVCTVDASAAGTQASVGANWDIIQVNLDGAVIGPSSATDGRVVLFDGTSGRLVKNSGVVLGDAAAKNTGTTSGTVAAGDDSRLTDTRTPTDNSVTSAKIADGAIVNADVNASAAIALSKLATDPLARANHTGTQTASTVSDFDTQVATTAVLKSLLTNRGDIITRGASAPQRLAVGSSGKFMASDGTDPNWRLILQADVSDALTLENGDGTTVDLSHAGFASIDAVGNDVQIFAATGSWTKPTNAKYADVLLIGAAGGGGSGRRGLTSTNRNGGGGGGGGCIRIARFQASELGVAETVTIGTGGTGAAGITSNSTDGGTGGNGTTTSFGFLISVAGGTGGTGGTNANDGANNGAGSTSLSAMWGRVEASAGAGAGGDGKYTATAGAGVAGTFGCGAGGGGGGGIDNGNTNRNGGAGGAVKSAGGQTVAGPGQATGGSRGTLWAPGTGGGGGQGGTVFADGGTGAVGSGGGGGGATLNGTVSGKGGNGGDGYCIVVTYT